MAPPLLECDFSVDEPVQRYGRFRLSSIDRLDLASARVLAIRLHILPPARLPFVPLNELAMAPLNLPTSRSSPVIHTPLPKPPPPPPAPTPAPETSKRPASSPLAGSSPKKRRTRVVSPSPSPPPDHEASRKQDRPKCETCVARDKHCWVRVIDRGVNVAAACYYCKKGHISCSLGGRRGERPDFPDSRFARPRPAPPSSPSPAPRMSPGTPNCPLEVHDSSSSDSSENESPWAIGESPDNAIPSHIEEAFNMAMDPPSEIQEAIDDAFEFLKTHFDEENPCPDPAPASARAPSPVPAPAASSSTTVPSSDQPFLLSQRVGKYRSFSRQAAHAYRSLELLVTQTDAFVASYKQLQQQAEALARSRENVRHDLDFFMDLSSSAYLVERSSYATDTLYLAIMNAYASRQRRIGADAVVANYLSGKLGEAECFLPDSFCETRSPRTELYCDAPDFEAVKSFELGLCANFASRIAELKNKRKEDKGKEKEKGEEN